jgi:tRNA-binding EMAP/Myf-like protein
VRISYEWLAEFVDLDGVRPKEAAEILTRLGVEVESLTMVDLSEIVIGRVLEQIKHPKSRHDLWVHQVDLGGGRVQQIIAGAPNAVAGTLVPVALPGTTVPNGKAVKDMSIAGYKASGMLCSAEELLLGGDHSGILLLDRGTPGEPLTSVIPSQAVMEAEITSNRPDEMGHLGRPGHGRRHHRRAGSLQPLHRRCHHRSKGRAQPGMAAAAAALVRCAADQQHRRHHQLRAARVRAAFARLRPREAGWTRDPRAPRA